MNLFPIAAVEFPRWTAPAEVTALPEGFSDSSWSQDVCPSVSTADGRVRIWIDYENPADRDLGPESPRFSVSLYDADGGYMDDAYSGFFWEDASRIALEQAAKVRTAS